MIHSWQRGSSQAHEGGLWIENSIISVKNEVFRETKQNSKKIHTVGNLKHSRTFLLVASSAGESHNYLVDCGYGTTTEFGSPAIFH